MFPFCVNSIALKTTMNAFLTNRENDIKETEKYYKGKDMVNGLARYCWTLNRENDDHKQDYNKKINFEIQNCRSDLLPFWIRTSPQTSTKVNIFFSKMAIDFDKLAVLIL